MAAGGQFGAALAVQPLELVVPVVECVREMRGRVMCLSRTDGAIVDHDDRLALEREHVRHRDTRDTRADDADIRVFILEQRRCLEPFRCREPH
jgi:hypothetical protein